MQMKACVGRYNSVFPWCFRCCFKALKSPSVSPFPAHLHCSFVPTAVSIVGAWILSLAVAHRLSFCLPAVRAPAAQLFSGLGKGCDCGGRQQLQQASTCSSIGLHARPARTRTGCQNERSSKNQNRCVTRSSNRAG